MVILDWLFDIPNNKLTCRINSELVYEALRGGHDGYVKDYKGQISLIAYADWRKEVEWIAENFPEVPRAKFAPIDDADWEDIKKQNPYHKFHNIKFYPYGINPKNNCVLDHMCRETSMQSNSHGQLFTMVTTIPGMGTVETPDGVNFYLRQCNPGTDGATFYNMQPCCVFPDHPGHRRLTEEEIEFYAIRDLARGLVLTSNPKETAKYLVLP